MGQVRLCVCFQCSFWLIAPGFSVWPAALGPGLGRDLEARPRAPGLSGFARASSALGPRSAARNKGKLRSPRPHRRYYLQSVSAEIDRYQTGDLRFPAMGLAEEGWGLSMPSKVTDPRPPHTATDWPTTTPATSARRSLIYFPRIAPKIGGCLIPLKCCFKLQGCGR
jgi:hypothetical protein